MADKTYGEGLITRRDFFKKAGKFLGLGVVIGGGIISLEKALSTMTGSEDKLPDTELFKSINKLSAKRSSDSLGYIKDFEEIFSKLSEPLDGSIEELSIYIDWENKPEIKMPATVGLQIHKDSKTTNEEVKRLKDGLNKFKGNIAGLTEFNILIKWNARAKVSIYDLSKERRENLQRIAQKKIDNIDIRHNLQFESSFGPPFIKFLEDTFYIDTGGAGEDIYRTNKQYFDENENPLKNDVKNIPSVNDYINISDLYYRNRS